MAGPQSKYSRRKAAEKTFEWWQEITLAEPEKHSALKLARYRAGLTQAQVATGVGVDESTVRLWENGGLPRPASRKLLAKVLHVSEAELWD